MKAYPFAQPDLEAIAKVLAEAATHAELTGLFRAAHLTEPSESEGLSKWKRIYNPLAIAQNRTQTGNFVLRFIQLVISPKRFAGRSAEYEMLRESANRLVAFHGWILNEEAKFARVEPAGTIDEAKQRAGRLAAELERRKVHADVISFCRAEFLQENYFHAVFEATKSVAEKIRRKANVKGDGADIVDLAFGLGKSSPRLAINALSTKTEEDEQRGFSNLLKGMFGMFRNVTGHAPKIHWEITEQDALDLLTIVSLIHRRLDVAQTYSES
jgi:uncharacterized protein (TIGR02391 family)